MQGMPYKTKMVRSLEDASTILNRAARVTLTAANVAYHVDAHKKSGGLPADVALAAADVREQIFALKDALKLMTDAAAALDRAHETQMAGFSAAREARHDATSPLGSPAAE